MDGPIWTEVWQAYGGESYFNMSSSEHGDADRIDWSPTIVSHINEGITSMSRVILIPSSFGNQFNGNQVSPQTIAKCTLAELFF